ncbi:hypothetical protein Tco_0622091 [Tanacetum coccineum]
MMMDPYTKNALWDYWKKGDDQEVLSDLEETYVVDEDEIAKIFRTKYDEFKNELDKQMNKGIPWVFPRTMLKGCSSLRFALTAFWSLRFAFIAFWSLHFAFIARSLRFALTAFWSLRFALICGFGVMRFAITETFINVVIEAVAATVNSPEVPQHDEAETIHNMSAENKLYFQAEKEAIFLLLTVNVQFLQQLQPEWSRFVTVFKQSKEIDTISYHTLFDILKQYQNEVNDIRAERIAKSANPLALLVAAQPYSDNYYQAPKPQRKNTTSSSKRPSASTRNKGKGIAKPVTPQSESVSKEDSDTEQA